MLDKPKTSPGSLIEAVDIARKNGVRYAYVGNTHNARYDSTWCHQCGARLIERDWYVLGEWGLTADGCCSQCGTRCAGVFSGPPGDWGSRRLAVNMN